MSTSDSAHEAEWVLVNFEKVEILPGEKAGQRILKVTGNTPSGSGNGCPVKLAPAVYVTRPEYWKFEVLWDRRDAIFQSLCSYEVSIPLHFLGTKGVEIVGCAHSEKIEVSV
jgi:hypothetical protein